MVFYKNLFKFLFSNEIAQQSHPNTALCTLYARTNKKRRPSEENRRKDLHFRFFRYTINSTTEYQRKPTVDNFSDGCRLQIVSLTLEQTSVAQGTRKTFATSFFLNSLYLATRKNSREVGLFPMPFLENKALVVDLFALQGIA